MEFKIGDVFQINKNGFDFIKESRINRFVSYQEKTKYNEFNSLKYIEIVDYFKHKRIKHYKLKIFWEDEKLMNPTWYSASNLKESKEIYKWTTINNLKRKIYNDVIWKISWGDIAKEVLLEGHDDQKLF